MKADRTLVILVAIVLAALAICVGMYYLDNDEVGEGTESFYDMEVGDRAVYSLEYNMRGNVENMTLTLDRTDVDEYDFSVLSGGAISVKTMDADEFREFIDNGASVTVGGEDRLIFFQENPELVSHDTVTDIVYDTCLGERDARDYHFEIGPEGMKVVVGDTIFGIEGALYSYSYNAGSIGMSLDVELVETNMNL